MYFAQFPIKRKLVTAATLSAGTPATRAIAEFSYSVRFPTDGFVNRAHLQCHRLILRPATTKETVMELLTPIAHLASTFREFVAPRYRPELYYMRGPGPAYARRMSTLQARLERSSPLGGGVSDGATR
jgi:hypothetical protein